VGLGWEELVHIRRRRGWEIPEHLATPESVWLNRRQILAAGALALTGATPAHADIDPTASLYPAPRRHVALAGLVVAALGLVPGLGYAEAVAAPLLARLHQAEVPLPGGCVLGLAQTIGEQIAPTAGTLAVQLVFLAMLAVRPGHSRSTAAAVSAPATAHQCGFTLRPTSRPNRTRMGSVATRSAPAADSLSR